MHSIHRPMRYGAAAVIMFIVLTAPAVCVIPADASSGEFNIVFFDDGKDSIEIDFNGVNVSTDGTFSFTAHSSSYDLYRSGIHFYSYTDNRIDFLTEYTLVDLSDTDDVREDSNNPSYVYYNLSGIGDDIAVYYTSLYTDNIDNGLEPETDFVAEEDPGSIYDPSEDDPSKPETTPSEDTGIDIGQDTVFAIVSVLIALIFVLICVKERGKILSGGL